MPRPVIDGVKNLIRRRVEAGTLGNLELDWFGGEPLVAKKVLFEIAEYANDLYDQGKIQWYSGSLTTNAYFLDIDTLQQLVALRQRNYQVSLDGFGADHDKTRKQADGSGSFEMVWKNLLAARDWKEGEFEIILRLHVTEESYRNMPLLCREIAAAFGGDSRFMVFFKRITNLGGPNTASIRQVGVDTAMDKVAEACSYLTQAGVRYSNGVNSQYESQIPVSQIKVRKNEPKSLGDKLESAPYICYASKPNSFVVRANGRLAKCTVAFADPKNDVGFIDAGGLLHIESEKVAYWTRGLLSGDHDTLGCPAGD
ncbi:hypothetical protein KCV01_g8995, partial [Aureobasidium melanogenum]